MIRAITGAVLLLAVAVAPARSQVSPQEILDRFNVAWVPVTPDDSEVLILRVSKGMMSMAARCGAEVCEWGPVPAEPHLNAATDDSLFALTAAFTSDTVEIRVLAVLLSVGRMRLQLVTRTAGESVGLWSESLLRRGEFAQIIIVDDFLPLFPLPAPRWTLRTRIPNRLGTRGGESFGVVFDRLDTALREAGVGEYGIYGIPKVNSDSIEGFAIVSRRERIDDDGRPADPRWGEPPPAELESLVDYFRQLFDPNPGRYRVIVLLVTARPIQATSRAPTRQQMENLRLRGEDQIPAELRSRLLSPSARVTALIYEFFRRSEDDEAIVLEETETQLTARDHLVRAGLWSEALGGQQ